MNIPQQLIPLSKKGHDFIRSSALAFASIARGTGLTKKNDEIAWDYFNGKINKEKFKYLTHIGELALPATFKHVSVQRPPMNLLISQKARRPFVFSVVVIDEASVRDKFRNQFMFIMKRVEAKVKDQRSVFERGYKELVRQKEQLQQQLSQEPQNEEQLQQMQMVMQNLPQIEVQMQRMQEEFEERLRLSDEELIKIKEYLTYEYKELKEALAQKGMKKIRQQHNTNDKSLSYFIDKLVTGKGFYYVDFDQKTQKLLYEAIDSMQVYYPSIQGVRFIQDGPWVVIEDYISYNMLIDQYGASKELTDDVMKSLEYYKEYSSGEEVGQLNANVYTGSRTSTNGINRKRIWWKSPRKVYVKHSPNKHKEGEYFRHFINDETKYDVRPNTEKGEKVVTYYIYDLYTATVIDERYVVEGNRVEPVMRSIDNKSKTELPVIGRSYSSYAEEPYSLIWNTKDLQDLYNIVNLHREYYIAASGVKGQIVDLSQKPKEMGLAEQRYHKKTGTLYIETVDKAGRKTQSPYNQWKDYDDTLSPNIQYLESIMMSISETVKETMGVSRQRMGQIVNSDQVGTAQMSRDQSSLITEILYYDSDQVEAMALRRAINLLAKFKWHEETLLQFTNPDLSTEVIKIPGNLLNKSDYDIYVLNNTTEEQKMEELKMLARDQNAKGMLPFKNIVELYNKESVVELQKAVHRWADEAHRLQQMAMQNESQANQEAIRMKAEMDAQLKTMVHRDTMELEKVRLQLDQARMELEKVDNQTNQLLKEKEINTNKEVELLKILSNRDVEMNYLSEQSRNNQVQEQLNLLQISLQELQIKLNTALGAGEQMLHDKEIASKEKIQTTKDRDKNAIRN